MIKTVVSVLILTLGILCGWGVLMPAQAQEPLASRVIEDLAEATLATYKTMVVGKLQQDGKGAASDYKEKLGFVPTPEAFMRRITLSVVRSNRATERRFAFAFSNEGYPHFIVRMKAQSLSDEEIAEVTAIAISQVVRTIRANYTGRVVKKLQKDGVGAALDYETKPGFIPLPAVFVRHILAVESFQIAPTALRSRWNLNEQQYLQDAFEHEGWDFLAKQQEARLALGKTLTNYNWKPYIKVIAQGETQALRFLSADTASAQACVTCHNMMESNDLVKTKRKEQGVEVGKTFERYELLGALSITVPLQN